MNTTHLRSIIAEQVGRLSRAIARQRRLQLLIAMLAGLIIGLASMAIFGGGVNDDEQHHDSVAASNHQVPGPDRDND